MKKVFLLFLSLIACSDSETPLGAPGYKTPVVTGVVITSEIGEELGVWGEPSENARPSNEKINSGGITPTFPLEVFSLYPMPTNGSFTIQFAIGRESNVNIWIVQAENGVDHQAISSGNFWNSGLPSKDGIAIKTLVSRRFFAGVHQMIWDLKDDNHKKVTSGFYRVYVSAHNLLAWRDVAVFYDPDDLPTGLRNYFN